MTTNANDTEDVVGYVDALGYLRCRLCMDKADPAVRDRAVPVYHGSNPHAFEPCDTCGRPLEVKS